MKAIRIILVLTLFAGLFATDAMAQRKKKKKDTEEFTIGNYEVQFVRTGLEGTTLFKIFSYGKNYETALENAKPDAIKAVIFKGIPGSDSARPMVREYDLSRSQRDFFTEFFDNKYYLNFVTISGDGSVDPGDVIRISRNEYKVGVVVSVHKNDLRKYLEQAGIINPLQRELLIDRVLMMDENSSSLEKIKLIVLTELWIQNQLTDDAVLEKLLIVSDSHYRH